MTEIAVREARELVLLSNEQLQYIANTEFVPSGLRGNMPAILACIATGRALGIADMTALRSIHVIDGRPTYSAELMVMLARQRGHSIQGEVTEGKARVTGVRVDNGDTMTVEWTLAMAERAGLLGKSNWRKYPEAMLWARAVSQLCRELFADVFAGATYTPEELETLEGEPERPGGTQAQADPGLPSQPAPPVSSAVPSEPASPSENLPEPLADADMSLGWKEEEEQKKYLKKLDVLVAKLRKLAHDPTAWIYEKGAPIAAVAVPDSERVQEGRMRWAPLRTRLSKREAHLLIDALEDILAKVEAKQPKDAA